MKIVKFGAAWCAGCLVMKPIWAEVQAAAPWLTVEDYDFDESPAAAEQYRIDDKLPVFIFLDKNGREFLRLQGEINKDRLLEIINDNKDK